jgi:phosphoglycolate phosphatase
LVNKNYYYAHLNVHTTAYVGVCEGIRFLNEAGHQLALLSNKPGDMCRAIMKHFGLDGYFTNMIGGGDVENLKPEPDGIFECL